MDVFCLWLNKGLELRITSVFQNLFVSKRLLLLLLEDNLSLKVRTQQKVISVLLKEQMCTHPTCNHPLTHSHPQLPETPATTEQTKTKQHVTYATPDTGQRTVYRTADVPICSYMEDVGPLQSQVCGNKEGMESSSLSLCALLLCCSSSLLCLVHFSLVANGQS